MFNVQGKLRPTSESLVHDMTLNDLKQLSFRFRVEKVCILRYGKCINQELEYDISSDGSFTNSPPVYLPKCKVYRCVACSCARLQNSINIGGRVLDVYGRFEWFECPTKTNIRTQVGEASRSFQASVISHNKLL